MEAQPQPDLLGQSVQERGAWRSSLSRPQQNVGAASNWNYSLLSAFTDLRNMLATRGAGLVKALRLFRCRLSRFRSGEGIKLAVFLLFYTAFAWTIFHKRGCATAATLLAPCSRDAESGVDSTARACAFGPLHASSMFYAYPCPPAPLHKRLLYHALRPGHLHAVAFFHPDDPADWHDALSFAIFILGGVLATLLGPTNATDRRRSNARLAWLLTVVVVPKGFTLLYGLARPTASLGIAVNTMLPRHVAVVLWLGFAFPLSWRRQALLTSVYVANMLCVIRLAAARGWPYPGPASSPVVISVRLVVCGVLAVVAAAVMDWRAARAAAKHVATKAAAAEAAGCGAASQQAQEVHQAREGSPAAALPHVAEATRRLGLLRRRRADASAAATGPAGGPMMASLATAPGPLHPGNPGAAAPAGIPAVPPLTHSPLPPGSPYAGRPLPRPRYRSVVRVSRLHLKIPGAHPSQLGPAAVSFLSDQLAASGYVLSGVAVREGCIEMVLELERGRPAMADGGRSDGDGRGVRGFVKDGGRGALKWAIGGGGDGLASDGGDGGRADGGAAGAGAAADAELIRDIVALLAATIAPPEEAEVAEEALGGGGTLRPLGLGLGCAPVEVQQAGGMRYLLRCGRRTGSFCGGGSGSGCVDLPGQGAGGDVWRIWAADNNGVDAGGDHVPMPMPAKATPQLQRPDLAAAAAAAAAPCSRKAVVAAALPACSVLAVTAARALEYTLLVGSSATPGGRQHWASPPTVLAWQRGCFLQVLGVEEIPPAAHPCTPTPRRHSGSSSGSDTGSFCCESDSDSELESETDSCAGADAAERAARAAGEGGCRVRAYRVRLDPSEAAYGLLTFGIFQTPYAADSGTRADAADFASAAPTGARLLATCCALALPPCLAVVAEELASPLGRDAAAAAAAADADGSEALSALLGDLCEWLAHDTLLLLPQSLQPTATATGPATAQPPCAHHQRIARRPFPRMHAGQHARVQRQPPPSSLGFHGLGVSCGSGMTVAAADGSLLEAVAAAASGRSRSTTGTMCGTSYSGCPTAGSSTTCMYDGWQTGRDGSALAPGHGVLQAPRLPSATYTAACGEGGAVDAAIYGYDSGGGAAAAYMVCCSASAPTSSAASAAQSHVVDVAAGGLFTPPLRQVPHTGAILQLATDPGGGAAAAAAAAVAGSSVLTAKFLAQPHLSAAALAAPAVGDGDIWTWQVDAELSGFGGLSFGLCARSGGSSGAGGNYVAAAAGFGTGGVGHAPAVPASTFPGGRMLPGGRLDLREEAAEAVQLRRSSGRHTMAQRRQMEERRWGLLEYAVVCGWPATARLLLLLDGGAGDGGGGGRGRSAHGGGCDHSAASVAYGECGRYGSDEDDDGCELLLAAEVDAELGDLCGAADSDGGLDAEGAVAGARAAPDAAVAAPTLLHLAVGSGCTAVVDAVATAAAGRFGQRFGCSGVYGSWEALAVMPAPMPTPLMPWEGAPPQRLSPLQVAAALPDSGGMLSYILRHHAAAAAAYGGV